MEYSQKKLTSAEWESIEIPSPKEEQFIIGLIKSGFHDSNIIYNKTPTFYSFTKLPISDEMNFYLYQYYFEKEIQSIIEKKKFKFIILNKCKNKKIKSADSIRLQNTEKQISQMKQNLFEFILIEQSKQLFTGKQIGKNYYILHQLFNFHVQNVNIYVKQFIKKTLEHFASVPLIDIIKESKNIFETNSQLQNYKDYTLYDHQKDLFFLCKTNNNPKLILYIAPTSTGKTMSPIGLSENYKIIFVCAARHVGLALAKNALSANKKIALAFDCIESDNIRLHYSAAADFTINKKSGGIWKVDNSNGENVEIMICDIYSYLTAMNYMLLFHEKTKIITFWDEPTIGMDQKEHSLHPIIQKNWSHNMIPTMILSSATLPKEEEIKDVIEDFKSRFGGRVFSIISNDCNKSIPLLDKNCNVILPHYYFKTHSDLKKCILHCKNYPTLLRYFELQGIVDFILYAQKLITIECYSISSYFKSIEQISLFTIKKYYLDLLIHVSNEDNLPIIQKKCSTQSLYKSNIYLVTHDSNTMSHGPTIYMTENVEKIGQFCLQQANIPHLVIKDIQETILHNNKISSEIFKLEKDYEDGIAKEDDKDKKMENMRISPEMKRLKSKIETLRSCIKGVKLNDMFIPNRKDHIEKWAPHLKNSNAFTCQIQEQIVIKIMQLDDVADSLKILLLMGIGIFTSNMNIAYQEIMKDLADKQYLFMIIASSDYIYGTNYQFCHGYIGKDLEMITQEKLIQALGRIGRQNQQHIYSIRYRDDCFIEKLLLPEENKLEVINMNKLFTQL